ncbi:hypothetical protein V6N13_069403 [Hibiscus sabdariffa]
MKVRFFWRDNWFPDVSPLMAHLSTDVVPLVERFSVIAMVSERVPRHFSMDERYGICRAEVVDIDNVLRTCPQAQMM